MPHEPTYGSDLVVDLLREAGIEHVAFNPGATFRGIHDTLVHEDDGRPAVALCLHEGVSIAVAQGYAKACGQPMAVLVHNVVGLQHASMAIYNAWCDRVPILILGGTGPLSKANRRPWIDWIHTASTQAEIVRNYVKWDDQPHDAASVTESFARGQRAAVAQPAGPVYLCYDFDLQEDPLPEGFEREPLSAYPAASAPAPDPGELARLAALLRDARHPALVCGYAGEDETAFRRLVELAEILGATVVDTGVRHAFPSSHELNATGLDRPLAESDAVAVLDLDDPRGALTRLGSPKDATVVNVTVAHLRLSSWSHDYQPLPQTAGHVTATADAAVAALLERLRAEPPDRARVAERRDALAERVAGERQRRREAAAHATADGVVALERLVHEVGAALADERFVLANATLGRLEHRLWELDSPRASCGTQAGGGLGYGLGATIGVSLARPGELVVDMQADGDLLYTPQALWTMAHLELPCLVVVSNNRQYGNTVEHSIRIARARGRDETRRYAGAGLADPPVDLAGMARAQGVWAAGPITDPDRLREQLGEAVAVVRSGRPALLDVLTPGF